MTTQRHTTLQGDLFRRHKTIGTDPDLRQAAVAALARLMAAVVGVPAAPEDLDDDV